MDPMRYIMIAVALAGFSIHLQATDKHRNVTVETAAWFAHKEGPYVGSCELEVERVDFLTTEDGKEFLRLNVKPDYPGSRRHLKVLVYPSVIKALGASSNEAAGQLMNRKLTISGKFEPIPTQVFEPYTPFEAPPHYSALVHIKKIDQLTLGPETRKGSTATLEMKDGNLIMTGSGAKKESKQ